jgi:acetoin:2,6-dichlorophenolindophenol oxidoreductase subunit beta
MHLAMEKNKDLITFGLGINDPKRIFGTTKGLLERFGKERVFEVPTSENTMTGVQVGLALTGIPSVVTHQRLDFFLLAMDQLVNSAAKWNFMFGGKQSIPIVIRLIIGKGWGQGPTHSQALHAWFSHIPGLKVIAPSTPKDAKELLLASIEDPNPIIFIEHRWLHESIGEVPNGYLIGDIGKVNTVNEGDDVTVIGSSFLTAKLTNLMEHLKKSGIEGDLIDLRSYSPLDWDSIYKSVIKTGRLIVFDYGNSTGSIAGEIIARVAENCHHALKAPPVRFAVEDLPEGSSPAYTNGLYFKDQDMIDAIIRTSGKTSLEKIQIKTDLPHDVPGPEFKGPF